MGSDNDIWQRDPLGDAYVLHQRRCTIRSLYYHRTMTRTGQRPDTPPSTRVHKPLTKSAGGQSYLQWCFQPRGTTTRSFWFGRGIIVQAVDSNKTTKATVQVARVLLVC